MTRNTVSQWQQGALHPHHRLGQALAGATSEASRSIIFRALFVGLTPRATGAAAAARASGAERLAGLAAVTCAWMRHVTRVVAHLHRPLTLDVSVSRDAACVGTSVRAASVTRACVNTGWVLLQLRCGV